MTNFYLRMSRRAVESQQQGIEDVSPLSNSFDCSGFSRGNPPRYNERCLLTIWGPYSSISLFLPPYDKNDSTTTVRCEIKRRKKPSENIYSFLKTVMQRWGTEEFLLDYKKQDTTHKATSFLLFVFVSLWFSIMFSCWSREILSGRENINLIYILNIF